MSVNSFYEFDISKVIKGHHNLLQNHPSVPSSTLMTNYQKRFRVRKKVSGHEPQMSFKCTSTYIRILRKRGSLSCRKNKNNMILSDLSRTQASVRLLTNKLANTYQITLITEVKQVTLELDAVGLCSEAVNSQSIRKRNNFLLQEMAWGSGYFWRIIV